MNWNIRYISGAGCAGALSLFAAYLAARGNTMAVLFLGAAVIVAFVTFDD